MKTDALNKLFLELGMPKDTNLSTTSLSTCMALAIQCAQDDATKISLVRNNAVKIMSEAKYFCTGTLTATNSLATMGHFGLGIAMYTHFTSPIRRYADVVVHRLLATTLRGRGENDTNGTKEDINGTKKDTNGDRYKQAAPIIWRPWVTGNVATQSYILDLSRQVFFF